MDRLGQIKAYVDHVTYGMTDSAKRKDAIIHLYGVSASCALLALRRGLDSELAAISGLMHDIYRYKTGIDRFHSHSGAEMARVALKRMKCFAEEEKQTILSAIFHHSDKAHVHGEYDEVLKDADTLQPFLNGDRRLPHIRALRLEGMAQELNLKIDASSLDVYHPSPKPSDLTSKRNLLADISETLAGKHIVGEHQSADYMEIIRCWPEEEAFDELKNGWCAAFVYYCCQKAGFHLPIKLPNSPCRLAGVAAWNGWARQIDVDFFIKDEPGVLPQRGDIVLYRNSIPPENKPEEQRNIPIDHIGVILGSDGECFTVAEGNVGNLNRSDILTRPLHQNIEGFIRIDNSYEYDGWKDDYKTGNKRIVPLDGAKD